MPRLIHILLLTAIVFASCEPTKGSHGRFSDSTVANDTLKIANDEIGYEVIIIEPGFNAWLEKRALPRGFYSQDYLEIRNRAWVMEFNSRVNRPAEYSHDLYIFPIDYQYNIDYGYEVNYLLYHFLVYFQLTYNQKLGTFVPRI